MCLNLNFQHEFALFCNKIDVLVIIFRFSIPILKEKFVISLVLLPAVQNFEEKLKKTPPSSRFYNVFRKNFTSFEIRIEWPRHDEFTSSRFYNLKKKFYNSLLLFFLNFLSLFLLLFFLNPNAVAPARTAALSWLLLLRVREVILYSTKKVWNRYEGSLKLIRWKSEIGTKKTENGTKKTETEFFRGGF